MRYIQLIFIRDKDIFILLEQAFDLQMIYGHGDINSSFFVRNFLDIGILKLIDDVLNYGFLHLGIIYF